VATFSLYKTTVTTENDISSYVYDISPFAYRINDDFTFELPEFTFRSTQELAKDSKVIVCETASASTKQCVFYVKKANYSASSKMWDYVCPHILSKLSDIKVREFGEDFGVWCDITPGYALWNNQLGGWETQGEDTVWSRVLVQALLAIKMMIYRVAGTSVDDIDSTAVDEVDSFYYWRYESPPGNWQSVYLKYKELGFNTAALIRAGNNTHLDWAETDFVKVYRFVDCLTVLRLICASMMVTIDIFRADYAIEAFAVSAAPTGIVPEYAESALDNYRLFQVEIKKLTGGSFEWVFGNWDAEGDYVPYTYGVDSPDRTIEEALSSEENTAIDNIRSLNVVYPNFMRLYGISGTTYQAHVFIILNGQTGAVETDMLVTELADYWGAINAREKYTIEAPGLELRVPFVEHDIASKRMTMEIAT
jgi:hypothetical protein